MKMTSVAATIGCLLLTSLIATAAPAASGPRVGFLTHDRSTDDALVIAQRYLRQAAPGMGLTEADLADMELTNRYVTRHNGVTHIYLRQRLSAVPVVNGTIGIHVHRDGRVINTHSSFVPDLAGRISSVSPAISPEKAIGRAAQHLGLAPKDLAQLATMAGINPEYLFNEAGISRREIPVKLRMFRTRQGVRLVWEVTIQMRSGSDWWSMWIDADSGKVLDKANLTASDNYEVYAVPKESPTDGPRTIETNPADATASPFGWHDDDGAPGAEFTDTRGNNVWAQEDRNANNSGGFRPDGGPGLEFQFPLDLNDPPVDYQEGAITNLFYWNNVLHDVHYRYGFDEASGNFQQNNYGNGGIGGDPVQADAQDGSGFNNANFSTPPDGSDPRMQMFEWTFPFPNLVEVLDGGAAGEYTASGAAFGPLFDLTGISQQLVLGDDGTGPDVNDGCEALVNDVSGKIAMMNRGSCNFTVKVKNAQNAGALAAVIVNNSDGSPITMGGTDGSIVIPSAMISLADGDLIKPTMPVPTNVRAGGVDLPVNRDSDLDNGIIAHEYGHGVSNRLTGGPSNVFCLNNQEQMGEGWSDYHTLTLTPDATDTGETPRGVGTYVIFEPEDGTGIRTFPYSTDLAINSHTYDDVKTEVIPHGVGSIWAAMNWEVYWNLIAEYGFDADLYSGTGGNNIAMRLVMDGLKLQPCSPGFVDGRDAILTADLVNNDGVNACAIWDGFAKRGLGFDADQGSPSSVTDGTENFDTAPECGSSVVLGAPSPGIAGQTNCWDISGATPGSQVHLVRGREGGYVTPGVCTIPIAMADARSMASGIADGNGDLTVCRMVPNGAAGETIRTQAVIPSDPGCSVSNVDINTY